MRLTSSAAGLLLPGLSPERELDPGLNEPPLGTWSGTRWQYTAHDGRAVDVICDLGGSVTLSLCAGTWILTWSIPGRGSNSVGGSFTWLGEDLHLRRHGADLVELVRLRFGADTLALSSIESSWDFGSGHEEAASFVAVFVRL